MREAIKLINTRIKWLQERNPPTGDDADKRIQAAIVELKFLTSLMYRALEEGE